MAHASVVTTLDRYGHLLDGELDALEAKLNADHEPALAT